MHVKPKKRLGQNFLIDKNIAGKIIGSMELKPSDIVLEIGAGRGEITKLLAQKVKQVYAVEIDASLAEALAHYLQDCPNVRVINRDILRYNLNRNLAGLPDRIKVAGNIPYYISSPIIEHLFKFREKIESIFITVQKEFAQRIVAGCGSKDYGSLSLFVQYFAEPKILFGIKKTCFWPAPGVDSCFLRLCIRQSLPLVPKRERMYFRIVRAAFNKRRKTLRNSLSNVISRKKLDLFFGTYQIDSDIRPERLSPQDFVNLSCL